ncbi:hypothetical protein [Treponema pectinovorum]|uniref:hypothetical protein n=1 Tax=Treponema pectinovorum TaxID=164 RepID=UPI0011C6FE33|nr:hypothetical protein [Treponema pectinovorum]
MNKKLLFPFFIILSSFISCSTDIENTTTIQKSSTEKDYGEPILINGKLKYKNWNIPSIANTTQYYYFADSRILYNLRKTNILGENLPGTTNSGNIKFLNSELSEFEYRWDGDIPLMEARRKILLLDEDVLVIEKGLSCQNAIGRTHILYKDITAYTDNVPFMGLCNTVANNYQEWFVFTPSGNCYKRYLNIQKNELLIVSGTWEKYDKEMYKIFWEKNNKNRYDILKGNKLYQNADENISSVPINLYVTNY